MKRCVQRWALAGIVVILAAPGAGSEASGLTKAQLLEVYEDKLGRLASFRLTYTDQMTSVEDGSSMTSISFVDWYKQGKKHGLIVTDIDVATDQGRIIAREVFDGDCLWRLNYLGPAERNEGIVDAQSGQDYVGLGNTKFLGYAGLYSIEWDGRPESYVPGASDCDMSVLLRHPSSKLLDQTEECAGHECRVLVQGSMEQPWARWWLAKDLGYAVVRREGYKELADIRHVRLRTEFSDFEEVAPGFFMAHRMHLEYWDETEGGQKRIEKILTHDYSLNSLQLEPSLTDEDFKLEFPKGTVVGDKVIGAVYLAGEAEGGFEGMLSRADEKLDLCIDSIVAAKKTRSASPMIENGGVHTRRMRARGLWLSAILAAALLAGGTACVLHRRRPGG